MTDEQKPLSEFEQYTIAQLTEAGKALEHHNFILRALSAEVESLNRRVPGGDEPPVEGQQRGTTTVFKLPDGFGMLRVTINPATGEALLDYGQQGTRQKAKMTFSRRG